MDGRAMVGRAGAPEAAPESAPETAPETAPGTAADAGESYASARVLAELRASSRAPGDRRTPSGAGTHTSVLERASSWSRVVQRAVRERPGVVAAAGSALCALALVTAALIVRTSLGTSATIPATASVTIPPATTSTTQPGLVVQAAGAVRSPGVHRMGTGSRIVDLLDRAGGPTLDLDLDRLNLAALLVDGQRVWFPRVGEPAPSAVGSTGASGASTPNVIDINQANADQLETLPGIGPVLASSIVKERELRGRFADVSALSRVKGLSRTRIDAIRELVTAS